MGKIVTWLELVNGLGILKPLGVNDNECPTREEVGFKAGNNVLWIGPSGYGANRLVELAHYKRKAPVPITQTISIAITYTGSPVAGYDITFTLNYSDGSQELVTLQDPGSFGLQLKLNQLSLTKTVPAGTITGVTSGIFKYSTGGGSLDWPHVGMMTSSSYSNGVVNLSLRGFH